MATDIAQTTTHGISINAPVDIIFGALKDSSHWPFLTGLTVYAERISGTRDNHLMRVSTVVEGWLTSCTVARTLDEANGTIYFHQTDAMPPLNAFGGEWAISPANTGSVVTVQHDFEVHDGDELAEELAHVIDHINRIELEALKATSERLAALTRRHEASRQQL